MDLDPGYAWQLRIRVGGIDFTSFGCESKGEAESLKAFVEDKDEVQKAEVERR